MGESVEHLAATFTANEIRKFIEADTGRVPRKDTVSGWRKAVRRLEEAEGREPRPMAKLLRPLPGDKRVEADVRRAEAALTADGGHDRAAPSVRAALVLAYAARKARYLFFRRWADRIEQEAAEEAAGIIRKGRASTATTRWADPAACRDPHFDAFAARRRDGAPPG